MADTAAKPKLDSAPPRKTDVEKALGLYPAANQALGPDDPAAQGYFAALGVARQQRDAARDAWQKPRSKGSAHERRAT